jgi:methylenetetrahydrofolate dehydrogenase (NADP+)/methenyltetrahydrofolate cyclohydrolase
MIIDGRKIAADMREQLAKKVHGLGSENVPVLVVMMVGEHPASRAFVNLKEKFAEKIGVEFRLHEYEATISTDELIDEIRRLNTNRDIHGIVVQLPLPDSIGADAVLAAIDPAKDVDALSSEPIVEAPVALAVDEIFLREQVNPYGKKIVVVGTGKLVGQPVAVSFAKKGADVVVVNSKTKNPALIFQNADIIIAGVGSPHFIKPEMVKDGAVLIDAGTSEVSGKVAGDIDPACAEKASLFSPVPGGVGPVTIACLFKNLLILAERQQ